MRLEVMRADRDHQRVGGARNQRVSLLEHRRYDGPWCPGPMGNLSIARFQPEQGIRRCDQCCAITGGYGAGAGHTESPPPLDLAPYRIHAQCLTLLREGDQHPINQRKGGADRRGGDPPDLLPGGSAKGRDSALRPGAGREHGVAGNQNAAYDHARQARGPAHVTTREIYRIDLSIDAAAIEGVVLDLDRIGKSPAGFRRPYWRRSVAGDARGQRGRWRTEVYAGRVDASDQQG